MPTQSVTLQYPSTPMHQLDLDAARLAAAKVVTPAATNSHGVTIVSVNPSAPFGNPAAPQYAGSQVTCSVTT